MYARGDSFQRSFLVFVYWGTLGTRRSSRVSRIGHRVSEQLPMTPVFLILWGAGG